MKSRSRAADEAAMASSNASFVLSLAAKWAGLNVNKTVHRAGEMKSFDHTSLQDVFYSIRAFETVSAVSEKKQKKTRFILN